MVYANTPSDDSFPEIPLNKPINIVVLTGAGISQESGIPTFRSSDGLWEQHRIQDVATPEGFEQNSALVYQFYNKRRRKLQEENIQPHQGHLALVELESLCRGHFMLVTQNIDDLHERAGSKNTFHMHGRLLSAKCLQTGECFPWTDDLDESSLHPQTGEKGLLRPDVVWFGEVPYYLEDIFKALNHCDVFIAIGTSGNVYPAAGFVEQAKQAGAYAIEMNKEPTAGTSQFDVCVKGAASETVPMLIPQKI